MGEGSFHNSCCCLLGRQGTPSAAGNHCASSQLPPARTAAAGPEKAAGKLPRTPTAHTAVEEGGLRAEGRAHLGHCHIGAWWWEMPLPTWARTSETRLTPGAQTWRIQPELGEAPVCTHQPLTASPVAPGTAQDPHQPTASSWEEAPG